MATLPEQTSSYISKNLPTWTAKTIRAIGYFIQQTIRFIIDMLHDALGH